MIDYRTAGASQIGEIKKIYRAHGWSSYLGDDEKLSRALENSLYFLFPYSMYLRRAQYV